MTPFSWRGLVFIGSFILLLSIAFTWGQLVRIQDGGYFRMVGHAGMALSMLALTFSFPRLSRSKSFVLIFVGSVIIRFALWSAPVSDDVNRYLWEGSLSWKGENPYARPSGSEELTHLRDQYWDDMNHHERLTAYPPGMELIMSAASWCWYDLQVFKVVALVGDFWTMGILVLLMTEMRKPPRWLCFYAFNPVILVSFAAEAHFDSMMVAALVTTLWFVKAKRWFWVWFFFGVAVQMKCIVIILLPYFIVRADRKKSLPFYLVLIIPSLYYGSDVIKGLEGLLGFGGEGAFNGGFYETLRYLGVSNVWSRRFITSVFVIIGLFFGWRTLRGKEQDLLRLSFIILGVFVACSPIAHFWYFSWVIPFLVIRPSLSWLVITSTTGVYYMAWANSELHGVWGYDRKWVVLTWLPFYAAVLWELRYEWRRLTGSSYQSVETIDLVIPVFNAADGLSDFLKKLKSVSGEAQQIIIADGGSSDDTVAIAERHGCVVVQTGLGRGGQIAAGMSRSSADLIAIIHADTLPRESWIDDVFIAAKEECLAPAFALGQRFAKSNPGLLLVEAMNEARVVFEGSIFGDQTLIVRAEALERMGGFPDQPLMEDVEVSWRLMEQGRVVYIGQEWSVSAVKWKRKFTSRFRQVISLMVRYRLVRLSGRDAAADYSRKLYREYYPEKNR